MGSDSEIWLRKMVEKFWSPASFFVSHVEKRPFLARCQLVRGLKIEKVRQNKTSRRHAEGFSGFFPEKDRVHQGAGGWGERK